LTDTFDLSRFLPHMSSLKFVGRSARATWAIPHCALDVAVLGAGVGFSSGGGGFRAPWGLLGETGNASVTCIVWTAGIYGYG
jgi:hypothetical protein